MLEDVIRTLLNVAPSQRRIQQDLTGMAEETSAWREQIIPWEAEDEMELLSLNHEFKWVKRSFGKMLKGVFRSIYHEPMMTYAYKRYMKGGKFALCFAATKAHQFIYQKQKSRTDFFIDGEYVGFLTRDWLMYSQRRRLLGRRNPYSADYYSVVIWDHEVAHLRHPDHIDRVNPRAFEVLERITGKEQLLLMAISFLTLVIEGHGIDDD